MVDPRVRLVTLTRVDVSPDLRNALVFWSALSDDEGAREELAEGLASASTFVRRRLAEVLPLRRVPALDFRYDPSLVLGQRTLDVLAELHDDEKA